MSDGTRSYALLDRLSWPFRLKICYGKVPATLALVEAEGSRKALWKLSWLKQGIAYELYVSDWIDVRGKPKKTPNQVKQLAESLLQGGR